MVEFILEEQVEKIVNKNTKEYVKEVLSSYNNGNYRAAVVVLYTTIIYDLLQKMVVLKEIYNDKGAEKILNEIKTHQDANPKSPEWESNLIENILKETKMITAVEKEELLHIKNERNYAAHPIINISAENETLQLKCITKETAMDLIRKAFEIVFLRDAILAKKIVDDIVFDLNDFYNRVGTDGLKSFLYEKYFRRMTQERKNELFKSLWKFVFILSDDDCNKNRESNYYGLKYLYNEDKNNYLELIKRDESFYFDKLELETIESWSEKHNIDINFASIYIFKRQSRIMCFIRFIEQSLALYKIMNDYSKNILVQSINHMFTDTDVVENKLYEFPNKDKDMFEEQVKLKSEALFLSTNISQHFKMTNRMRNNYMNTSHNWTEPHNYCILDSNNLDTIFQQAYDRGCTNEFITFLISYFKGACQFSQTNDLFDLLIKYKKHFKEEHFYLILAGMNDNSQYYDNRDKNVYLNKLEKLFMEVCGSELFKSKEEKYLYKNLFNIDYAASCDADKVMELIEKRALNYSTWSLSQIIFDLLNNCKDMGVLKGKTPSSYPNITRVLNNKEDPNFKEYFIKQFAKYFNDCNIDNT